MANVTDIDRGWARCMTNFRQLSKGAYVKAGIQEAEGAQPHEGSETPLIKIAAIHEYGGVIDHPGGTPYMHGFKGGKFGEGGARFIPKARNTIGQFPVTRAHKIRIPQRSFIRGGADANRDRWFAFAAALSKQWVDGKISFELALKKLGQRMEGDLEGYFTKGTFEPLKPATIKRKGSSRPLIDKNQLRGSIRSLPVLAQGKGAGEGGR